MRKAGIYTLVCYAITWIFWIGFLFFIGDPRQGEPSPFISLMLTLGMFMPVLATLISSKLILKEEKFTIGIHPRFTKKNIKYYIAAWLCPSILTALGIFSYYLIFPGDFSVANSTLAQSLKDVPGISEDMLGGIIVVQLASGILLGPLLNLIFAFGEEGGWRGYLYPALQEKFSERAACLVTGVIWGLWHAPITVALGHNYGFEYPGYPFTGVLTMVVFCIFFGTFLSYLQTRSQSVWPAALAHGAINAIASAGALFFVLGSNGLISPTPAAWIGNIPLILLGFWCFTRLSGKRPKTLQAQEQEV